jgi:hypothetical protein
MKVVDINGVYEPTNIHELETILMKTCGNGFNSFWLSHEGEEYPTLSLLVKDNLATLNYLPKEYDAGFRSVGRVPGLKPGDTTTFSINTNRADDLIVQNDAVLPFSTALQAAKEFFFSKDLPRSVDWLQL